MVRETLVAVSGGGPLVAICKGLLSCLVGALLYLSQSDSFLGVISGGILSHCGRWLLLSSGRILLLSCGIGLGAPLEFQWFPPLRLLWGPLQSPLLFFGSRCSSQIRGCSSLLVSASSQVTSGRASLFAAKGFLSIFDVSVISCLLVVREASPVLVSSVIVASGSCCVAAKDSGVPL